MSTTDGSSNHSEIIKVMNAQMKNLEAIGNCCCFFQYGKMNDTKHTKTLVSVALGNSLDYWVGRRLINFFLPNNRRSRPANNYFFCTEAEKTCSGIEFEGSVGQLETILFLFRPKSEKPSRSLGITCSTLTNPDSFNEEFNFSVDFTFDSSLLSPVTASPRISLPFGLRTRHISPRVSVLCILVLGSRIPLRARSKVESGWLAEMKWATSREKTCFRGSVKRYMYDSNGLHSYSDLLESWNLGYCKNRYDTI